MEQVTFIQSKQVGLGPSECLSIVEMCSTLGNEENDRFLYKEIR